MFRKKQAKPMALKMVVRRNSGEKMAAMLGRFRLPAAGDGGRVPSVRFLPPDPLRFAPGSGLTAVHDPAQARTGHSCRAVSPSAAGSARVPSRCPRACGGGTRPTATPPTPWRPTRSPTSVAAPASTTPACRWSARGERRGTERTVPLGEAEQRSVHENELPLDFPPCLRFPV